jgi:negative regulator of sigma E activity
MALPLIATVAAKLGIEVGKYVIKKAGKKVLKKGAADKLRKQVAAKKAKSYKVTPKSFKKKPMTQAQARHATRPKQKKYETNLEIGGKKYKLKDSDGGTAARRKGINPLDRSDASRQRLLPDRVKKKAGKTKVLKQKTSNFHWSEGYK